MEIAWSRAFSTPVICVMEKDNIHNHSMLNYSCGYIVETLEQGIEILKVLLGNDNQVQKVSQTKRALLLKELLKIQQEKEEVVKRKSYEKAAGLRDKEKSLISELLVESGAFGSFSNLTDAPDR